MDPNSFPAPFPHHPHPGPAPYPHHQPPAPEFHPQPHNDTNNVLWQWLCYALWEWVLLVLSVFLSALLTYFLVGGSDFGAQLTVYSFAILLCLVPFAYVVERRYRSLEPAQKSGFAGVVLVINGLLVFTAMLGGLITAVIGLFSLIIDTAPSATNAVVIISSVTVTLLGALLFARLVQLRRLRLVTKYYPHIVAGLVVLAAIFMFAGPFRTQVLSRADRVIEDNIGTLDSAIISYGDDKGHLPASLDDLDLSASHQSGAKQLVADKLVSYQVTAAPEVISGDYNYGTTVAYELCMTFQKVKGSPTYDNNDTYAITTNHGAGRQCYDLTTTLYPSQ